ncbi:hypothetical protein FHR72_001720 [Mycolicibacterium iranicum]|uniref:Uncharacterized protein n=1 Tax=Mycolicibacterium iranicum TaxID=912594 RepID=A0A839QAH5_MYCIR|nr:hypothetical protein [Mycolicibacterium iranicum]MBB2990252.1 hypothetical protein [Mycolicibacterium iranicum]
MPRTEVGVGSTVLGVLHIGRQRAVEHEDAARWARSVSADARQVKPAVRHCVPVVML